MGNDRRKKQHGGWGGKRWHRKEDANTGHVPGKVLLRTTGAQHPGEQGETTEDKPHVISVEGEEAGKLIYQCPSITMWGWVFVVVVVVVVVVFLPFLGPLSWYMEVPRLGGESELWPPAYARTTATQDPSRGCNLHHSSQQS